MDRDKIAKLYDEINNLSKDERIRLIELYEHTYCIHCGNEHPEVGKWGARRCRCSNDD